MDGRTAYLRPSASPTWTRCPGYVGMRTRVMDFVERLNLDVTVREEGTACHWLSEQFLTGAEIPALNALSPNRVYLEQSLFDATDVYVDAVKPLMAFGTHVIEHKLDCGIIYPGMQGTIDFRAWDAASRTLFLRDAKFGYRYVSEDTPQLSIYAVASMVELGLPFDNSVTVDLGVVQPRVFGTQFDRSRRIPATLLAQEALSISEAAQAAMADGAMVIAGRHCFDCEARYACPAFAQLSAEAAHFSAQAMPFELDAAQLGAELERVDFFKSILDERSEALRQQALFVMQQGGFVNNHEVVDSYGREVFPAETYHRAWEYARRFGVETSQLKPLTPAQVRAKLPAHARPALDQWVIRPHRGQVVKQLSNRKTSAKQDNNA